MLHAALVVSLGFALHGGGETVVTAQSSMPPQYMVADSKKEEYDPGKDITDDPHGGNPHGPGTHGPDPHDENHDPNLPGNNPNKYFPVDRAR